VIKQEYYYKQLLQGDFDMFRILYHITVVWILFITPAYAINLDLSPIPLSLGGSVEPNIMFTLDDSGSMQWEVMPDENRYFTVHLFPRPAGLYGGTDYTNQVPNFDDNNLHNFFERSPSNNALFYNPDITYVPWSNSNGTSMADANPNAALYNPNIPALGSLNLRNQQTQNACWFTNIINNDLNTVLGAPCFGNHTYWPITYYIYNTGSVTTRASYTRTQITSATSSSAIFTSPNGLVRTRDQEIQNFANWFQYYRSRILAARAGIGRAFAKQGTNIRVGFSAINQGAATIDGVASNSAIIRGLRPFSGTDRTTFFSNLYGRVINNNGTPLRNSLDDVGKYFQRTDNKGPWSENPGTTNTAQHLICRQSYNILMTDGYWNGASPGVGDVDGSAGLTITGPNQPDFQYSSAAPYRDGPTGNRWSNTLADVAMHYWNRDLRTDLANQVPVNPLDPAFWQHMVNFTVGLGVTGTLDSTTDWANIQAGTTYWPDPSASSPAKIDDLWHAAVNSRGGFFSATDPDAFAKSLSDILSAISDRTSSASSVALNSGTVSGSSQLYQARFDSGEWSGQLLAFPINLDGTLASQAWDAGDLIPAANDRVIITHDGTEGQPFRWADISSAQQTLLTSENLLNYLRGAQNNEASNGGTFRNRNTVLGDIIHGSPTYVGAPILKYPDNWGASANENSAPYSLFKSGNVSRQAVIYVGANDGMLHAINAVTGIEIFGYMPNSIMNKVTDLADVNYNHKYYVDGNPIIVDAFFDSDGSGANPAEWHSVLVSGLRGGAQGVFALDVTDPTSFSTETSAATNVLWEFTDNDDKDLGFTYGEPSIVRLQNGKWAAIFSGGYNNTYDDSDGSTINDSTTGNAVLYIVDLSDGSLIKKFDTKVGSAQDPTGNNRPNGLSTPSAVDFNGDSITDAIYAGDLFGNVWKIDVSGTSAGSWKFSYKTGSNPKPIYTACANATCNASNSQAITTQVQVIRHPSLSGYLVLFGTGKYFEVGDNSTTGQTTHTFYGIWDKDETSLVAIDKDDLLEQKIIKEVTSFNSELRVTTQNAVNWNSHSGWYLDLINSENGNTTNYGERQVSNAIVRNGRIIFTTLLPSDDQCDFGGSGWLMELDVKTGARLTYSPFDLNGDGLFSISDYVNVGDLDGDGNDDYVPVSGKKSKVGNITSPSISNTAGGEQEFKYTSGSTGSIEITVENPGPTFHGRQSWRQLDFNF
tara:strand:+ start:70477 stop:74115 length:3639 start_codon:yes stop_codon:yes gene_type:complete